MVGVVVSGGRTLASAFVLLCALLADYSRPPDASLPTAAKAFFTPFNLDTISQSGYGLGNAFLTLKANEHVTTTAFVRNVGNTFVKSFGFVGLANIGNPVEGTLQPPRTYGVTVGYKF